MPEPFLAEVKIVGFNFAPRGRTSVPRGRGPDLTRRRLGEKGGMGRVAVTVNVIGAIGDDPTEDDKHNAAFNIRMDGATIALAYVEFAAAEAGHDSIVRAIND